MLHVQAAAAAARANLSVEPQPVVPAPTSMSEEVALADTDTGAVVKSAKRTAEQADDSGLEEPASKKVKEGE